MASSSSEAAGFATTQWSLVALAVQPSSPESKRALADLCQAYWYPLYLYVRRPISDLHAARDLTQDFFARLLEKGTLAHADPRAHGRFRSFLLAALPEFPDQRTRQGPRPKRGGTASILSLDFDAKDSAVRFEPSHELTPERLFEQQWAVTFLEHVLAQLALGVQGSAKGSCSTR